MLRFPKVVGQQIRTDKVLRNPKIEEMRARKFYDDKKCDSVIPINYDEEFR